MKPKTVIRQERIRITKTISKLHWHACDVMTAASDRGAQRVFGEVLNLLAAAENRLWELTQSEGKNTGI